MRTYVHTCTKCTGSFPSTTKLLKITEIQCLIKNVQHPSLPSDENLVKPDNTKLHKVESPAEACRIRRERKGQSITHLDMLQCVSSFPLTSKDQFSSHI